MTWRQISTLKYRNLEVPVWSLSDSDAFINASDLPEDIRQAFFTWMLGSTVLTVKEARWGIGYYPSNFDDFMKRRGIGASGDFSVIVDKYL